MATLRRWGLAGFWFQEEKMKYRLRAAGLPRLEAFWGAGSAPSSVLRNEFNQRAEGSRDIFFSDIRMIVS